MKKYPGLLAYIVIGFRDAIIDRNVSRCKLMFRRTLENILAATVPLWEARIVHFCAQGGRVKEQFTEGMEKQDLRQYFRHHLTCSPNETKSAGFPDLQTCQHSYVHKEKRMFSRRDSNIKGFKKSTKNLLRLF
jgi:hypothetical protein